MLKYKNVQDMIKTNKYPPINHDYWHIKIDNGDYLIHFLAYNNNDLIIKLIEKKPNLIFVRNKTGLPFGHILVQQNNFELLDKAIATKPIILKATDADNMSVLFQCLYNYDFVKKIVQNKMTHINHIDNRKHTVLSKCITHGYDKTFNILKKHGALAKFSDINLYTLVMMHHTNNDNQNMWFKYLLNFEDPNRNSAAQSPLSYASSNKNMWAINWLLSIGSNINHNDSTYQNIVLTWIKNGYIHLIEKYFDQINFNVMTIELDTPLHVYLKSCDNINPKFAYRLLTTMTNKNFCNIFNESVFHILPVNTLLQFPEIGFVNLWLKNRDNVSVFDKWNNYILLNPNDKETIHNLWWSGFNQEKHKAYDAIEKLKNIQDNVDLRVLYANICKSNIVTVHIPNIEKILSNDNTLFTNFYQHLGLYNTYYLKKYDILCIPPKTKYEFNINPFDTEQEVGVKLLLETFRESCEYFDNKIVWYSTKCKFFPRLPQYFKNDKLYFYNIHIVSSFGNHANLLLIDTKQKLIEIFEPHGYKNNELSQTIYNYFSQHPQIAGFQFINDKVPTNFNAYQTFENMLNEVHIGDVPGYCLAWSYWYLELRAINHGTDPIKVFYKSIQEILQKHSSIRNYIRNYSNRLTYYKNTNFLKLIEKEKLKLQVYENKEMIYNKQIIEELLQPYLE